MGLPNDSADVNKLQEFLNSHMDSSLPVTGFFGALTKVAVEAFQTKYYDEVLAPWVPFGLPANTATGFVGKTTRWKINDIQCPALDLPFPQIP